MLKLFLFYDTLSANAKEVNHVSKVATNLSLDQDLKKGCIELFTDLGLDLSTAVNMFLKQSLLVQGLPFRVTRDEPNLETIAAMNEYHMAKVHPERYPRYSSFKDAMNEVLDEA